MKEQKKEEAERIIKRFFKHSKGQTDEARYIHAKQCALICIEEILNSNNTLFKSVYNVEHDCCEYWRQVKEYINKNY